MRAKILNSTFTFFLRFLLKYGVDKSNSHVLENIYSDLYRYTGVYDEKLVEKEALSNPGFRFTLFLRLCKAKPETAFKKRVHAFSYYFHKKYFFRYGYQIPIDTKIGKGFQILHFGNIVLNPKCKIGINCTIAQGVLIGQNKHGVPDIGNNVWIGANAIVVGDIKIGNNVLIAPGAFINKDVPDNSLVIGNPGTVISKSEKVIEGYIVNRAD